RPSLEGHAAIETLSSGQRLFVQTLLPGNPSINTLAAAAGLNPIAELEPTKYILTVEDPARPLDARFFHVLQGADPGVAMTRAGYLRSAAGLAFDGAAFGTMVVYFPVNEVVSFSETDLDIPTGVHTALVTGLKPNASYGVMLESRPDRIVIRITSGGHRTTTADRAGVLRLTF